MLLMASDGSYHSVLESYVTIQLIIHFEVHRGILFLVNTSNYGKHTSGGQDM